MSDYEYVEINSPEDLERFIESATKEELILLKHNLEEAKKCSKTMTILAVAEH